MRPDVLKTILLGAALPLMGSLVLNGFARDWIWTNYPAHSALEAIGSLAGIAIACFILVLLRNREIHRRYIWIAAGLVSMGLLDGVHALLQEGQSFVWTHSLANMMGGLLFAGVWLPPRLAPSRRHTLRVLGICIVVTLILSLATLSADTGLPVMIKNGAYSPLASGMNLIGGAGFVATAFYITFRSGRISKTERLVFSSHASLFGIASLMFEMSAPWDAAWWLWHGMRTCAYLVAFGYFLDLFQRQLRTLKFTEARLNHALDTVFDSTQEAVLFVDHNGHIASVNPAARRMFCLPDPLPQRLVPTQLLPDVIPTTARHVSAPAIRAQRADGSTFEAEISQTRLRPGGPFARFITVRDISERKESERQVLHLVEELQAKTSELEQSNAELDTFAYVASHDLRAPLRTIQNAVTWLEEDLNEHFNDDTRDTMDIILRRTRRMEHLLEDLMLHSRIGRTEAAKDIISGQELVTSLTDLALRRDGFRVDIGSGFDEIYVQKLPLLHVLLCLVDNAIKHNDGTSGTVYLSVREMRDKLVFAVTDDGPGIAERYQDRIFEMFTTLHPRDKVEGSGMGLAIARKYASVSGGTISVQSKGRGSRFTVTWPKVEHTPVPLDRSA